MGQTYSTRGRNAKCVKNFCRETIKEEATRKKLLTLTPVTEIEMSSLREIQAGVPQGSVLSPTRCSVCINDIY
jgi:hypothetical protein